LRTAVHRATTNLNQSGEILVALGVSPRGSKAQDLPMTGQSIHRGWRVSAPGRLRGASPRSSKAQEQPMTGQFLYYLAEGNLRHKILAIVEEQGARKAGYALTAVLHWNNCQRPHIAMGKAEIAGLVRHPLFKPPDIHSANNKQFQRAKGRRMVTDHDPPRPDQS
jgi:hypothetical protein